MVCRMLFAANGSPAAQLFVSLASIEARGCGLTQVPVCFPPNEHRALHLMAYTARQLSLLQCTSLRRIDLSDNPLESPPLDCIVSGGGWSYVKTFLQKILDAGAEGGKLLLDSMHFSLLPSMVGPRKYSIFWFNT